MNIRELTKKKKKSKKITFKREEISECQWDSGKYGAADGAWENCVRSQGAYFE